MTGDKKKGFTLIEVLVALSIFSVVVTIATDFFFAFYRTQHKTENLQAVGSAARSIMERIVREVRENEIDYASYGGQIIFPSTKLALEDFEDKPIIFEKSEDADCPTSPCLKISTDGVNWSSLTPKGIRVKDLKFYISPQTDPFKFNLDTLGYEANEQPYILILLALENVEVRPQEHAVITLQTGVSSRVYKR